MMALADYVDYMQVGEGISGERRGWSSEIDGQVRGRHGGGTAGEGKDHRDEGSLDLLHPPSHLAVVCTLPLWSIMQRQADEEPLYIFDHDFVAAVPELATEYTVPHVFDQDLLQLLGGWVGGWVGGLHWLRSW